MAAPTNVWTWKKNLYGLGPPAIVTLEATSSLETKLGTALIINSGQLDTAEGTVVLLVGLAAEVTSAAATAGDPISFEMLRPGDVIKAAGRL